MVARSFYDVKLSFAWIVILTAVVAAPVLFNVVTLQQCKHTHPHTHCGGSLRGVVPVVLKGMFVRGGTHTATFTT